MAINALSIRPKLRKRRVRGANNETRNANTVLKVQTSTAVCHSHAQRASQPDKDSIKLDERISSAHGHAKPWYQKGPRLTSTRNSIDIQQVFAPMAIDLMRNTVSTRPTYNRATRVPEVCENVAWQLCFRRQPISIALEQDISEYIVPFTDNYDTNVLGHLPPYNVVKQDARTSRDTEPDGVPRIRTRAKPYSTTSHPTSS